jgi:hypothetical protein
MGGSLPVPRGFTIPKTGDLGNGTFGTKIKKLLDAFLGKVLWLCELQLFENGTVPRKVSFDFGECEG